MVKFLSLLPITVLCVGCSTFEVPFERKKVDVTWYTVDNAHEFCKLRLKKDIPFWKIIDGCAFFNKELNKCVIVTNKNTSLSTVGHELRHCFEGKWHE